VEGCFRSDAIASADEVFLTGTGAGIQPVAYLDGKRISAPGPLTIEIQRALAAAEFANSTVLLNGKQLAQT
jgi:branched-subunit amino acid aminotransferase/4-amino-4-deoxychorismate lyase